jgi:hypothetical protein
MLDSDVQNADSHLFVEFYVFDKDPYKDQPFIRIMVPGDKTNVVEQPVRDYHKERFPRQWLHFQMQNNQVAAIGRPLVDWHKDRPEEINDMQLAELQIMKFQTVEQVATASDSQLQKVGMGAAGLRERARSYLMNVNKTANKSELDETKRELEELKAQMAAFMAEKRGPGRPRKED